ncbi:MAG TPA: molybdopterin synthase sulfur carrier subunit [Dehalococcoidia bacterium]|jgi:molybdopterin synthase sulfur carrier subunit|nr:molybdopterin synthase sulfur carrier subunit [Dehalococcoidia bacterium]|tara:strand:+ start:506 stop:787 length:282 start_codon:yes stop_codon:yes gene_type:complete
MSITVRIPSPLRRLTEGKDVVDADGGTIKDVIENLELNFNGFKERLIDENGEMRYFVNVYLNGEDVRFLDGILTKTNKGDEISIVPAVAGGKI